jgi:hypothetical protein
MGTEISDEDLDHIHSLCDQVISLSEYRIQLFDYLKNRMAAIAPNLTVLVGELVGARLIAHAGSLINLAKHPVRCRLSRMRSSTSRPTDRFEDCTPTRCTLHFTMKAWD